jgi:nitrogenase iron protein NifH
MVTEHLVVTGKSGAGVSTTAVNLSAALAAQGYRIAHLGYDRRRLSSSLLRGNTVLQATCGSAGDAPCDGGVAHCALGYHGILCVERGTDGEADAAPHFAQLRRMELVARFQPDYVVHDFAGEPETVMPFLCTEGEATRIILVACADFAALITVNRFLDLLLTGAPKGSSFGGIVANNISGPFFQSVVDDFARQTATVPFASIPRSLMVSTGEYLGQSVLESAPDSHLSSVYRKLARLVAQGLVPGVPQPLSAEAMQRWLAKWSDITEELEWGLVRDGAAI